MKRYWFFCTVLFIAGISIAVFSAELPANAHSGEMPPEFGAGVIIAELAVVGFAGGIVVKVISILLRKRH